MLSERQKELFELIVESFVEKALPVGSQSLREEGALDISSATIRNEMHALEEQGLIEQPFTSAGRIPTEKGYLYYVEYILDRSRLLPKKFQEEFRNALKGATSEERIKNMAKCIASFTRASVAVGFSRRDTYYTGIAHLFENPEFSDYDFTRSISLVVDRLEENMDMFFDKVSNEIEIFVGRKNPLHPQCTMLVGRIEQNRMIGIFGPMRMNYQRNYATLSFIQQLFLS